MSIELAYSIISVSIVSVASLVGILALSIGEETLHKVLFIFLGFSGGAILGSALLDLLPESIELISEIGNEFNVFIYITIGFLTFFFIDRYVYWYHGHGHKNEIEDECKMRRNVELKSLRALNLIGDAIHNFIDGMVISVSYLYSIPLGITTTIAVLFHEIPQEIGDIGLLIYSGLKTTKALILNFISALTAFMGVFIVQITSLKIENVNAILLSIACGGFIYLAASEIIPEMQREKDFAKGVVQFILFIMGIVIIFIIGLIFE